MGAIIFIQEYQLEISSSHIVLVIVVASINWRVRLRKNLFHIRVFDLFISNVGQVSVQGASVARAQRFGLLASHIIHQCVKHASEVFLSKYVLNHPIKFSLDTALHDGPECLDRVEFWGIRWHKVEDIVKLFTQIPDVVGQVGLVIIEYEM